MPRSHRSAWAYFICNGTFGDGHVSPFGTFDNRYVTTVTYHVTFQTVHPKRHVGAKYSHSCRCQLGIRHCNICVNMNTWLNFNKNNGRNDHRYRNNKSSKVTILPVLKVYEFLTTFSLYTDQDDLKICFDP